ncbi:MAG: HemK family protein methyltransferase [Bacilli bacterium]|nr:HemK family protein methyltransferase [Bacilli bacterium]
MPTNREAYFEAIKLGVPKPVVVFALCEINDFDYLGLTKCFDEEIKNYALFKESMQRYIDGEMIEYIFNRSYFLQLPLYVDKNVLIPRQETEELVLRTCRLIETYFKSNNLAIADVCSGSGAIGLYLAANYPMSKVYLSDYSKETIRVAKKNAENLNLDVEILKGDMLTPFIESNIKLDVIVCNPPYIEDESTIDEKTWKQEPHLALLAKPCTKYYEQLLINKDNVLNECYLIAFEIGEDMKDLLEPIVKKHCPNAKYSFEEDMYGKTRYLFIVNTL